MYNRKLGILVRGSREEIDPPVAPPLSVEQARVLYGAFLTDLFARLSRLKKVSATVFCAGEGPLFARDGIAGAFAVARQPDEGPGARFENAFRALLDREGRHACVMGSESPDLPLVYLKRAYVKLKHRDIVLGPTYGGGCYLIGLKRMVPGLFDDLPWGEPSLLGGMLRRVESAGLSCALLPPWYEVNTAESLSLFETMLLARRIERKDRLPAVERVLESIRTRSG